jgi:hypothetical protein
MSNMNVNSSHSQEYWSQYGAPQPHKEEDELDEDGEALMDGPTIMQGMLQHWHGSNGWRR